MGTPAAMGTAARPPSPGPAPEPSERTRPRPRATAVAADRQSGTGSSAARHGLDCPSTTRTSTSTNFRLIRDIGPGESRRRSASTVVNDASSSGALSPTSTLRPRPARRPRPRVRSSVNALAVGDSDPATSPRPRRSPQGDHDRSSAPQHAARDRRHRWRHGRARRGGRRTGTGPAGGTSTGAGARHGDAGRRARGRSGAPWRQASLVGRRLGLHAHRQR